MSEIKTCPFCGAAAKVMSWTFGDSSDESYRVGCADGHVLDAWSDSEADAIALWNERPAPKPETDGDARKLAERILQIADDLQDKWDGGDHADMFDKVTERYIDKIAALIQSHDAALGQSAGEET